MKLNTTDTYLRECLKQARFYEFTKDCDRALTVLKPFWGNIEEFPNIEGLDEVTGCELLTICGSIISSYGTTRQIKEYQQLADAILSRAREMAIAIGERDLIAEAEKHIAVAYWRHGQFDNAVAFLNTVLGRYSELEQLTKEVCLRAQANLLMLHVYKNDVETAYKILEKIKPFVDDSEDLWLKTGFYSQAGGVYVSCGRFEHAIPFLEKAAEYAEAAKNFTYLGGSLNNLSNAYIHLSKDKIAMKYINKAIDLFLSINQIYNYALALETKAQVYSLTGNFKQALLVIDESIKILEKGESYEEYCRSLWTRTEILVKSGEKLSGMRQYNNLIEIVKKHLNLAIEDFYIAEFEKLLYLQIGKNFEEKEMNYRKSLLDEAFGKCGGIVTTAAKFLGIKHQTLSKMISKFPDLREKHNIKQINRSTNSILFAGKKSGNRNEPVTVIKLKTDRLKHLGLPKGTAVRFERCSIRDLDLSKPVVIQDYERKYHCGFLVDAFDMFAFEDGLGNIETTFVASDILDVGQVVEVFDEGTNKFIPLENF